MTDRRPPNARQRIGGPWAISLRGYAVVCVLLIVGSVLTSTTALGTTGVPGPPALFVVAQCALVGAVLAAAHLTVFRNRTISPMPIWTVVALGVVVGLVRPAYGAAMRGSAGLAPLNADLVLSATVTVILTALLLPTLAYAFATRAWYATERARLIARSMDLQARRLHATGAIDAARDLLAESVDARLATSRAHAAALRADTAAGADQMADLLMRTARDSVRPLSHELWGDRSRQYPSVTWRQVVACEAQRHPLPILVPSIGLVVIAIPLIARTTGALAALVMAAVAVASVGVVFRIGRLAIRRCLAPPAVVVAAAVVAAAIPFVLTGVAFFGVSPFALLPTIAVLVLLLVAGGAPAAASETADSVIMELQALVAAGEVEQLALEREHDILRRELAAHLHGTLQPRLVNASHVVREAARTGDPITLEAAMRDAESALGLGDPTPHGAATMAQVVDAARHDWARVLDVTWDVSGDGGAAGAAAVADVIRESLANAVVHGHAASAVVAMREQEGVLLLTVTDDGRGPQAGLPGLGAEVLDHATGRRWELRAREGGAGSVLTATIGG